MQVPILNQSVGIDATQVPEIKAPGVVPGAFGEDIGKATENLGKGITSLSVELGNYMARENYYKEQAQLSIDKQNLHSKLRDIVYSNDPIAAPAKPQSNTAPLNVSPADASESTTDIKTIPAGYLNRQGFDSNHSLDQFRNQTTPIMQSLLKQYAGNPRLQKQAEANLGDVYQSYEEEVVRHQQEQFHAGMNNAFSADTNMAIQSTSSAGTPESLKAGITQIENLTAKQYSYKGSDPDTISLAVGNNVANAVSKAAINKLTSTGDIDAAKSLLDTAKDSIPNFPMDRYDKIDSMITTGYDNMQKQAHVASVQKTIGGQADLLTGLAQGKTGWMNIDDVARLAEQGIVSDKFAKAYTDVIASEGKYQPREDNNLSAPKYIDAIYAAKSQTELHDHLISMMQDHKGMSQDEMSILINSAMKRSGSLPLDLKYGNDPFWDPKQKMVDAGARAVVNFGRQNNLTPNEISFMYANYYNAASKGASIPDATDQATRQYAISKYPALASVEGTPTAIASPGSSIKYLHFNSNTTVEPGRIWNPKTGVFDVNTNRAKSAKGDKNP